MTIMKKSINKIIDYRYYLAVLLFVLCVFFNFNGSSIGNWNNFGISEMSSGTKSVTVNSFSEDADSVEWASIIKNWVSLTPRSDGTIVGVPRMIRTDEWLVQTPFAISQANTGNHYINKSYGLSGMDMVVAYNAPVRDISVIGKPFNWGYLIFGAEKGVSWYWSFKMIGMLLLGFEFSMILTKKNRFLSVIGGFWITFTPAIQWWFMQHLGDVVYFSLAIAVALYHYFHSDSKLKKIGMALILVSSIIGFTLVIYPAFQIPFAYLLMAFFLFEFIWALKNGRIKKWDWIVIASTLILSGSIIIYTLYRSWDALVSTLNTVYPGRRLSVGGDITISHFSDIFISILLPFKIPSGMNQVESATSVSFFPALLIAIPIVLKKEKIRSNLFGIFLVLYSTLLAAYSIIGIPKWLAKVTFFSYVTGSRAWQTLAVIGVFTSIWFISYLWREHKEIPKAAVTMIMVAILCIISIIAIKDINCLAYLGKNYILGFTLIYALITLTFVFSYKKVFVALFLPLIVVSGMTINPLVKGIGVIENKALSSEVESIVKSDSNAYWVTETMAYNYPQMFGAKTINSVRFYPDVKLMSILDPNKKFEDDWNRYAHMRVTLTPDDSSMRVGSAQDILDISLSIHDLQKLNVSYVLTTRNLTELYGNNFELIYNDKDNNNIYRVVGDK